MLRKFAPEPASPEVEFAPEIEAESVPGAESHVEAHQESSEEAADPAPRPGRVAVSSWRWIKAAWKGAPRDLKLVTSALPVLLVAALTGAIPKVPIGRFAPQQLHQGQKTVEDLWKNLNQTVLQLRRH